MKRMSGRGYGDNGELLSEGVDEFLCLFQETGGNHPFHDPFVWIYSTNNGQPLIGLYDEFHIGHVPGIDSEVSLNSVHREPFLFQKTEED